MKELTEITLLALAAQKASNDLKLLYEQSQMDTGVPLPDNKGYETPDFEVTLPGYTPADNDLKDWGESFPASGDENVGNKETLPIHEANPNDNVVYNKVEDILKPIELL